MEVTLAQLNGVGNLKQSNLPTGKDDLKFDYVITGEAQLATPLHRDGQQNVQHECGNRARHKIVSSTKSEPTNAHS